MTEPDTEIPTRRNGRIVAFTLLSLIALTVGSALVFWFHGREPMGPIERTLALDDHAAVVVRKGYRQRDYVHLTVRDVKSGQRWKMALWAMLDDSRPLVRDGLVMLRVRDQLGRPETHAFRLPDGKFAWRGARVMRGPEDRVRGASVLGADRLFECSGGPNAEVFALDPATGREVFHVRRPGGDGLVVAVAVGNSLLANLGDGKLVRFDAQGHAEELGVATACDLGGSAVVLRTDGTLSSDGHPTVADPSYANRTIAACTRTPRNDVVVLAGATTRVIVRPRRGDLFATLLDEPGRLGTSYDVPTGTSGSTIPLVLGDDRLVVLDSDSGSKNVYALRREGTPTADASVVLGAGATFLAHDGFGVAFLPNGEARVVELVGPASTRVLLTAANGVAYFARGEGLVAVDFARRAVVGASGPLGATFSEGGLTRLAR